MKPNVLHVRVDDLVAIQDYAYRDTIEAKKIMLHLRQLHGDTWREHLRKDPQISAGVLKELSLERIDETPPIWIARSGQADRYIVTNGIHSTMAYREQRVLLIPAYLDEDARYNPKARTVRFDQIRIL